MTIEELSARLERVERANRRMRAVGIAALVLAAAGVAMGQAATPVKILRAERFEVVDGGGKVRAELGFSDGGPSLTLRDEDGNPRGLLKVRPDGAPWMVLRDKGGMSNRAALSVSAEGSAALHLSGGEGYPSAALTFGTRGAPALELMGKDGVVRAALTVGSTDSAPALELRDTHGKPVFRAPQ